MLEVDNQRLKMVCCCWNLFLLMVKLTLGPPVVYLTNILRAALPPIFLRQKSIKPNFKYKKSCVYNFCTKKCWWNWYLSSVSPTFWEQLFCWFHVACCQESLDPNWKYRKGVAYIVVEKLSAKLTTFKHFLIIWTIRYTNSRSSRHNPYKGPATWACSTCTSVGGSNQAEN
jgi:hypothetical protein